MLPRNSRMMPDFEKIFVVFFFYNNCLTERSYARDENNNHGDRQSSVLVLLGEVKRNIPCPKCCRLSFSFQIKMAPRNCLLPSTWNHHYQQ
ncbi:hypothetical protein CEXT_658001 [Caerostris extrusa]|uniref:Secreted protein n=1 Tax=Caerostris extrusa TaxID=172846 RepID=A0AAV4NMN4_CAEEX|nr:hypothetical protein CEXT_658001 [Caerostris extrusa]